MAGKNPGQYYCKEGRKGIALILDGDSEYDVFDLGATPSVKRKAKLKSGRFKRAVLNKDTALSSK